MINNTLYISSSIKKLTIFIGLCFAISSIFAQSKPYEAIYSGLPWYDQNGKVIAAHGGNILKEGQLYYFFGEVHSDTSNAFTGFNCYSSKDLYQWKFETTALPIQPDEKLGTNRIGERPKVMKCPSTGEFIMLMHVDTLGYKDQFVGYATAPQVTGPYHFKGPILFNGKPIKKWDMGTFQDDDGTGYLLTHGGTIHQLSKDYKSIENETNKTIISGFESPTLFKRNNIYYFIGSHLTSWEKNDNYYYTSSSLSGPWVSKGLIAPKDKLTWNSQSTFVLKIKGTKDSTYVFMGDRWSYPKQLSAASYVWQPLVFSGNDVTMPVYQEAWQLDQKTGQSKSITPRFKTILANNKHIKYSGNWKAKIIGDKLIKRAADSNASLAFSFKGQQVGIKTMLLPDQGYAEIKITDKHGKVLVENIIDLYAKNPVPSLVFLSPTLAEGHYALTISVTGERPQWSDKKRNYYGSTANYIAIEKILVR